MKQLILHFGSALLITALIVWLNIRPYGILLIIVLALWIYKTRCPNIMVVPPPNLMKKLKSSYDSLVKLRHDKPGIFFIITSISCIMFAIVGLTIPGTWLVLIALMIIGLIATRNKFEIIKKEPSVTTSLNDTEVDEFLLEENENNLFVLKCAGEDAVLTGNASESNEEDKSESEIPPELLVERACLPEIGELSDSNSEGDVDDVGIALTKQIDFKPGYFNKDFSSSDDDSITSGLNFPDCNKETYVDSIGKELNTKNNTLNQQFDTLKNQIASKLLPSLVETAITSMPWSTVSNLMNVAGTTKTNDMNKKEITKNISDSSDDSEFEILNTDDLVDNTAKM